MADNSKFVLRWEIDPSDPGLATGVFSEGGFKWTITAARRASSGLSKVDFSLHCNTDHNNTWRCEGDVDLNPIFSNGEMSSSVIKGHFCFDENRCSWLHKSQIPWIYFASYLYTVIELHINIISLEKRPIIDLAKFSSPHVLGNVSLLIGDKKVQVSKEYLAVHSPVFATMFYGEFVENGKEEVEIKEVVYERVLDQAKLHLTQSMGIDTMTKLGLADLYRLADLKDHCLNSFTSATELLEKMHSSPEYANFSGDMKIAICDRMVKLKLQ